MKKRFYGKYRGIVSDNSDKMFLGRVKAKVPDVFGTKESGWAYPCAPFGGDGAGMFVVPKKGAGVWIEFEQGNPEKPIWSGVWWGATPQVPTDVFTPVPWKKLMIKTEGGTTFILDDTPITGGITLKTASGQVLKMTATGIELTFSPKSTIKLGPKGVSVNDGALEVI